MPPPELLKIAATVAASIALVALAPAAQDEERGRAPDRPPGEETASAAYARRHAVVIGVNEYTSAGFQDLRNAAGDAQAFAGVLVDDFGFAREDVRLIADAGDATQRRVLGALEDWCCDPGRVGPDDLVVVYFAGHGATRDLGDHGARGYVVPGDARTRGNGEPLWSSLISMSRLEDISVAIPAKHVVFVLDCCFSGLAIDRASGQPLAAGLSRRARQVITAGDGEQTVNDAGGEGHSVFTGALLDGLGGEADTDLDAVISFGELYTYVSRVVEHKTARRQVPLQANLPDHKGGNAAFFPPGRRVAKASAAEQLRALERTTEEQLEELKRLSDALLVRELEKEAADELWPQFPATIPDYRRWLGRAGELLDRLPLHRDSVERVREEIRLGLVLEGVLEEGTAAAELDLSSAPSTLRWRFETFGRLVAELERLAVTRARVEERLIFASNVERLSLIEPADLWRETIAAIAADPRYGGLELAPQMGLVPIGRDPESELFEFADLQLGLVPERGPDGRLEYQAGSGVVFVLVPGGTFLMGAQKTDPDEAAYHHEAESTEGPPHEVELSPFFLSKYELTQGQWLRATGVSESYYRPEQGAGVTYLHPVEMVSWDEARTVLARFELALPTEAQWEYAARGGSTTPWWSGEEPGSLEGAENIADLTAGPYIRWEPEPWRDGHVFHAPVGSFRANAFGLHDVLGNVREWCLDGYHGQENFYARSGRLDPVCYPTERYELRVSRGGHFYCTPVFARSSFRWLWDVHYWEADNLGVRPARSIAD